MKTQDARRWTDRPRVSTTLLLVALLASVGLGAGVAAAPRSTHPSIAASSDSAALGAALVLTWTNQSPLGFRASPCFNAGANSVMCNGTYWVNKDPNGTCAQNGTGLWISNVATSVSTKFYFDGVSPQLPSALTFCGGGTTAKTIHFWFHVIPNSGTIRGTAYVIHR